MLAEPTRRSHNLLITHSAIRAIVKFTDNLIDTSVTLPIESCAELIYWRVVCRRHFFTFQSLVRAIFRRNFTETNEAKPEPSN